MAQFQVECVETSTENDQRIYSRFVIEPLDRGQGITVGNALRRILLSGIEGTAVTAVRVAGANHEFSTIPGVREDVLDILPNMKGIVLRSHSSQTQIGRLSVHGPAIVQANHFELPSEVELVNPHQYVATVSEGSSLEMEFQVERGRGYRMIERSADDSAAMDYLRLDATFMPVRRVNYDVRDMRVGGAMEKDSLVLEIETDGSLNPQEALSQAASILVDLFNPLKDISFEPVEAVTSDEEDPTSQIPIEELQLSVRAYNCLKRAQINSVSDLLDYTQEDLLEIKNFGQKSAEEVIEALQVRLGITLPQEKSSKPV